MIRSILKGQRGGVAIAIALGFMAFSMPLISGSLNLAQATNIDARVKSEALQKDYCGIAVREYVNYLLADTSRWDQFLADNVDPLDPTQATVTVNVCGRDIELGVTQQPPDLETDPLGNPIGITPNSAAYQQRDFQTFKTVSNPSPEGGDSVTYTITTTNRSVDATTLTEIHDTLPAGFIYDCAASPNQLTLPGQLGQPIVPVIPCPAGNFIQWEMPPGTSIEPGQTVKLIFDAVTAVGQGTYCNEAKVITGNLKTRSGQTAIVAIDEAPGLCPGEAVVVTQTLDYADLVASDLTTIPYTYTLEVGYTIKVENIGTEDLEITGFIDLLPVGYSYSANIILGSDITDAPSNLHYVSTLDRQRVTWKLDGAPIVIAAGTTKTLKFKADGTNGQGNYWVDLLADFQQGSFDEKVYTWPTALVAIKDTYLVTGTDANGNEFIIALQVEVQGEDGLIAKWNIN